MVPETASTSNERPRQESLERRDFALLFVQLAALCLIVWQLNLEPKHHLLAGMLAFLAGFAVHVHLPLPWRLPFFAALSLACFIALLGPVQGVILLLVGGLLIGVVLAPLPFYLRMILLINMSGILIVFRQSITGAFWIVLGSLFMFRMISYLFCVRRQGTQASLLMTGSYFFLLPNAFFSLFPVVDYTTYCRSYYNDERRRIYQRGIHWLSIGIAELVLYRLIKYELLPNPVELKTVRSLAWFLAMNYSLYVYVSGTFHIICGMLHLFGFNLPRTHDNYFLASSFTDIWRRINIYWKDFLMKVFFMPSFYFLRRYGTTLAMAVAVMWVFLWTWLAHAWQQFWLLGVFPLRPGEALLWLTAGAVVAVNAILDYRKSLQSHRGRRTFHLAAAVIHSLKVVGIFSCVSLFWATWTHPEVVELLSVSIADIAFARGSDSWLEISSADVVVLGTAVVAVVVVGVIVQFVRSWLREHPDGADLAAGLMGVKRLSFDHSVTAHLLPMIVVLALLQPPLHSLFGQRVSETISRLGTEQFAQGELMAVVNGYYEQLSEGSVYAGPLLGNPRPAQPQEVFRFGDMTRRRADLMEKELIPGWSGDYAGGTITINRWGMRDRDRQLVKSPGTYRIALVGSSVIMGAGVDDTETMSRLLESRLNEASGKQAETYEVLNFGMGQYSALHRRHQIHHKVLTFDSDVIIYCAHQEELDVTNQRLATAIHYGVPLEDPCLEDLVERIGVSRDTPQAFLEGKIRPHLREILQCTYNAIAEDCRSRNVGVLYLYLPLPGDYGLNYDPAIVLDVADAAGMTCADLSGWWGERSTDEVLNTQHGDYHPNSLGHQLIADSIDNALRDYWNGAQLDRPLPKN